jgi:hypothetical protein
MKSKDVTKVLDATQPKTSGAALASWGPKADDLTVMSNIGAERAPKGQFIKAVRIPLGLLFELKRLLHVGSNSSFLARPRWKH